jgi:hypothetical protein
MGQNLLRRASARVANRPGWWPPARRPAHACRPSCSVLTDRERPPRRRRRTRRSGACRPCPRPPSAAADTTAGPKRDSSGAGATQTGAGLRLGLEAGHGRALHNPLARAVRRLSVVHASERDGSRVRVGRSVFLLVVACLPRRELPRPRGAPASASTAAAPSWSPASVVSGTVAAYSGAAGTCACGSLISASSSAHATSTTARTSERPRMSQA